MLTYKSAWAVYNDDDTTLTMLTSMSKAYAARVAVAVTQEAVPIHGDAGQQWP